MKPFGGEGRDGKGDGLQGGEAGRSGEQGREWNGGIKGVARQGFRTHTLPRALPQGALDTRTHACQHSGRRVRCALLYLTERNPEKLTPFRRYPSRQTRAFI